MREIRTMRLLAALICIALLVFATVTLNGAHPDPAVFVLPFRFFVVFAVCLLAAVLNEPAVQSLSFLTLDLSRAPPSLV